MTATRRAQRSLLPCLVAGLLLHSGNAAAQHETMNCNTGPTQQAKLAEGDQNTATHLGISRRVAAGASINLDICSADLTIKGGKDDLLRVNVDLEHAGAKGSAGDYLQALDVTSQAVNIKLNLPKHPLAKVVIVVPATIPSLQVNLVRGELSLETDQISGDRRINVVSGHVDVLGNTDSYKTLHAGVVLGSFHDRRPGGGNAHGIISKSLSGTGRGSIDINVVSGSLDLKAWD